MTPVEREDQLRRPEAGAQAATRLLVGACQDLLAPPCSPVAAAGPESR